MALSGGEDKLCVQKEVFTYLGPWAFHLQNLEGRQRKGIETSKWKM